MARAARGSAPRSDTCSAPIAPWPCCSDVAVCRPAACAAGGNSCSCPPVATADSAQPLLALSSAAGAAHGVAAARLAAEAAAEAASEAVARNTGANSARASWRTAMRDARSSVWLDSTSQTSRCPDRASSSSCGSSVAAGDESAGETSSRDSTPTSLASSPSRIRCARRAFGSGFSSAGASSSVLRSSCRISDGSSFSRLPALPAL